MAMPPIGLKRSEGISCHGGGALWGGLHSRPELCSRCRIPTLLVTSSQLLTHRGSLRRRFVPPKTKEFTLHQIPSIAVAPGLEMSADLEYYR